MREKLTTVIIGFGKIASGYDKKMARYFEFQLRQILHQGDHRKQLSQTSLEQLVK